MKIDVLRYLGYEGQIIDSDTEDDLNNFIKVASEFKGASVYKILDREKDANLISKLAFKSNGLDNILKGCQRIVYFAATLGTPFERCLKQWQYKSPTKMFILSACGSDRIEIIIDEMVKTIEEKENQYAGLRYSPGYGDFELSSQKTLIDFLEAHKKIGISINSSFVMMPSKTVTGLFGLSDEILENNYSVCDDCLNRTTCDRKICRRGQ